MKKILRASLAHPAFRFVLTIGIANLFADMTYEGGGSVNGQYMTMLGASVVAISVTAGLGEFFGYALRALSGYLSDRTGKPWLITFIGYAINLLSVPAMALVHSWPAAAVLIFSERIGRAIRKPTTEAMLSYTTTTYGAGWVYALNTALDETGATLGPLLMSFILFHHGSYRLGYALLIVSSLLALISLVAGKMRFPIPSNLEVKKDLPTRASTVQFGRAYWIYMMAGSVFAAGMLSYELVSIRFLQEGTFHENFIPVLLAFATAVGIAANLILGKLYDRTGMPAVYGAILLSSMFAPLLMRGGNVALFSLPLVGIAYAVQDTLLKAIVAKHLPDKRRGFAFGLFYSGYGCGWLVGSVAIGFLYQQNFQYAAIFSAAMQLLALPIFVLASRVSTASGGSGPTPKPQS